MWEISRKGRYLIQFNEVGEHDNYTTLPAVDHLPEVPGS